MSKPWEADDDFVMYLNSGDRGTHPLQPGVTTVRSAFRQELEIPLSLSPDWQVALFSFYYMHSFSNAVLKSPTDWHCQVGYQHAGLPPVVQRSIQLSRHQQFTHFGQVLQELIQQLGLSVMPTLSGGPIIMDNCSCRLLGVRSMGAIKPKGLNWIIFDAI